MSLAAITIVPADEAVISGIVDLIMAQRVRQLTRDPRLAAGQVREEIESTLREQMPQDALVALDGSGRVQGYAEPAVWALKASSILLSFLTPRNGIVQKLTLPDPANEYALAATAALLAALDRFWKTEGTTGDLLRWPSCDSWCEAAFIAQGFQLDSVCALRPLHPFFDSRPATKPGLKIRSAQPDDEERLIELFQEELLFHEPYTPFVHSSPQVLDAFRRKLSQLWESEDLEGGASLVLVAERESVVVAMTESKLVTVVPGDEPGFTPSGRYWCIDNMSVRPDQQGQGIGRLLVQTIEDMIAWLELDLDGYILWFNPDNPSAARFWPHLGFQPLWTTYQCLHTARS